MGGYHLEIFKMALYITFPVGMFYYFNRPELFEEWVIKTKREMCPPQNATTRELEAAIKQLKEKQELARLKQLEGVKH